MKILKSIALAAVMLGSAINPSYVEAAAEPYPLEYFALRPVISGVSLSPDGKQLSLLKIPSKNAKTILEIYDSNSLDKEPFRVNADPMEIRGARWLSDSTMLLILQQKVSNKIDGFNRGAFRSKLAKLDLKTKKIKEFQEPGANVVGTLPEEPNKVLLRIQSGKAEGRAASAFELPSYYKLDVNSGRKSLVMKGSGERNSIRFDRYGNPWLSFGFDETTGENLVFYREKNSKNWREIFRLSEMSFENFSILGKDPLNEDVLFVNANNGKNTSGLWEFNTKTKKFGELIYARKDVDVAGARTHSNFWKSSDIVAVRYTTDKNHYEYFDEIEEATYKQLESVVPFAYEISIGSRSRDGKSLTVFNRGPKDPGTYYLLKDGQLKVIGSTNPLLDKEKLANVKMISYKSRHGDTLRGYLTVPNGKGPFPLVVMPHGGPYASVIPRYDEWGQMFANNGYMVFEPEFRGSLNRGLEFYKSAFIDGSEAGRKMQDDKDDGAIHLIKQGLVDKDRIAMYGWSYGGYAALVAASREDQIYQCTMAGAAVSDPIYQNNLAQNENWYRGTTEIEQANTWRTAVSPVNEVTKVNVPVLLIHGSVDQRVPIKNVQKYIAALEKNNKYSYKYIELEGEDHFGDFSYENKLKLYDGLINYLKNDCGPGGL